MKNIHVLTTYKASRVLYNSTLKSFCIQKEIDGMFINDGKVSGADFWGLEKALNNGFQPHNIYITSDEEIKEGDWVYNIVSKTKFKATKELIDLINDPNVTLTTNKKIILTTDQDLIRDGVQAIDDEFLKWFVKNPSCENIEVKKEYITPLGDIVETCYDNERLNYKITIPKEEPNQVGIDWSGFPKSTQEKVGYVETKQETLEESMNQNGYLESDYDKIWREGVEFGAKWQQERMYSEEEVYDILIHHTIELFKKEKITLEDFWNKFKKK